MKADFFHSLKFVVLVWTAIFVVWIFSNIYEWLFYYWWVDVVLHFAGGFWVFVLSRYITDQHKNSISGERRNLMTFLAFISFVAFAGVLWEFFEFVLDRYIILNGYTYLSGVFEDTLSDLLMDILGGITAFVLYFKNGKA